ncbi:hypothetical protein LXL04_009451 [Taraxacum kok-saghyz]
MKISRHVNRLGKKGVKRESPIRYSVSCKGQRRLEEKACKRKPSPNPSEKRSSIHDSPILKLNRVNIERETESEKACKRVQWNRRKRARGNGADRGCGGSNYEGINMEGEARRWSHSPMKIEVSVERGRRYGAVDREDVQGAVTEQSENP